QRGREGLFDDLRRRRRRSGALVPSGLDQSGRQPAGGPHHQAGGLQGVARSDPTAASRPAPGAVQLIHGPAAGRSHGRGPDRGRRLRGECLGGRSAEQGRVGGAAMKRLLLVLGALLLVAARAQGGEAPPGNAVYALIMGVNHGVDTDLQVLHYADDDAVRYQELFRALGARTALLTRLDRETTALSPQAAAEALPPTRASLRNVVASLAAEIRTARQRGVRSSLYVVYA